MTAFARLMHVELLKLRRTLAFRLALLMPLSVVLLGLLLFIGRPGDRLPSSESFLLNTTSSWAMLVQPLLVAVICALVHALEHRAGGWRRLYVLPVSRMQVYLAKLLTCTALLLLATLTLVAATWTVATAMWAVGRLSGEPLALAHLAAVHGRALLAVLGVLAIQHVISMRFRSFVVPLALAMVGTLSLLTMVQSETYWRFNPWTYGVIAANMLDPALRMQAAWLGLAVAAAVAALAAPGIVRRSPA